MTKTVFFGTQQFAATILKGLLDSPLFDIVLVISRPDEPVGRKQIVEKTPVKILAEKYGIPVEQPVSLKNYRLSPIAYELGVTAQYGGLIPKHILEAPAHGILNVHTSLLPKYRGASPIQSAIMNGDRETGVTIMKMDEGLDTGPILLQRPTPIGDDETSPIVEARLAELGVSALHEAVPDYVNGALAPKDQNHENATECKKLTRESGRVEWNRPAKTIYNQFRALQPWPGVWTEWRRQRLKLLHLRPHAQTGAPGTLFLQGTALHIGCEGGSVVVEELQLEGKKPMSSSEFLNGYKQFLHDTIT